jgi:hypothetical protein
MKLFNTVTEQKREKPRLIGILTVLLILQAPIILFLGLNLLTRHWTFLISWDVFWSDIQEAFELVLHTPGIMEGDEVLLYSVTAFAVLVVSAGTALCSGLIFNRGGVFPWILSLITQIGILVTGIVLYFIYKPSLAYWLIAMGILMVLYLNYGDVREWFLHKDEVAEWE